MASTAPKVKPTKARGFAFFAVAVLTVLAALRAQGATEEDWFKIYISGKIAGTLHTSTLEREGGGHVVRTRQQIRLQRGAVPVEVEVLLSAEEDGGGRFLGFKSEQKFALNTVDTQGSVENGVLVIKESAAGGRARETRVNVPADAVGFRRSETILCEHLEAIKTGKNVDRSVHSVIYIPELNRFGKQTTTFGEIEDIEIEGVSRKLRRVTVSQEAMPGMKITQWVDSECNEQMFSLPIMGMTIEYVRSTREEVLEAKIVSPPEIFFASAISVKRSVPAHCDEALYRLTLRSREEGSSGPLVTFLHTGQTPLSKEGKATIVRIRKTLPGNTSKRPVEPPEGEKESALPNTFVQSDDPAIRKQALDILNGVDDAWEAAKLLERWVYRNVREKNLETGFATAKEVFEQRQGDCTEHAVLLAAMARAAGIPSRLIGGLLYHRGAFVGHMWCEVFVGSWAPLDATLGKGSVGAHHIALSTSTMAQGSTSDLFLGLMNALGNLDIEVLKVR